VQAKIAQTETTSIRNSANIQSNNSIQERNALDNIDNTTLSYQEIVSATTHSEDQVVKEVSSNDLSNDNSKIGIPNEINNSNNQLANIQTTHNESASEIKNNAELASISLLKNRIEALQAYELLPLLPPTKLITSQSTIAQKWGLDFSIRGMYLNNFISINPHGDNAEYINNIQENTRIRPGYMIDMGIRLTSTNGWMIGLRGSRTSMYETFTYQYTKETTESLFNDQAFLLEGKFIGATQEVTKITSRKVLHQNEYRLYNISPSIGYQWNSWANILVQGGVNYTITNTYNGKLLTPDGDITNDLSTLFPMRRKGITGYFAEGAILKPIAHRLQASLHLRYQKVNSIHDNSNTDYSTNLSSLGIGLGLNYRLF